MTTAPAEEACAVEGCGRPVKGARHKHCSTHGYRARKGLPLDAPVVRYASGFDRLFAAAVELAGVNSEDDAAFDQGKERLRKAYRDARDKDRERLKAEVYRELREQLARLRTQDDLAALLARLGPHEGPDALPASPDAVPAQAPTPSGRLILTGKGSGPAEAQASAPSDRAKGSGRRARRRR